MKTLQRLLCLVVLFCIVTGAILAQGIDTTKFKTDPPASVPPSKSFLVAGMKDTLWLSDSPTVLELTKIFAAPGKGKLDPFLALQAVTGKGDSAVSALELLLFSDPIAEIITTKNHHVPGGTRGEGIEIVKSDTVRPNHLYAAMALEAIGTKNAYPALYRAAQMHPNIDVRGIALNALAGTYHDGERLQKVVPDKKLVHLFLSNVDDTTNVPQLAKSFGQIAREGLINWLGQDFGEPQGKSTRLVDAKGVDRGSIVDFREQWWAANEKTLVWDSGSKMFIKK